MNNQWSFGFIIGSGKLELKSSSLGKIDLVSGQRKLPSDSTPYLHIDLWPVKSCLIRYLHIGRVGFDEHIAHQLLSFDPEGRLIYIFFAEFISTVQRQTHHVFVDAKNFKILKVHVIHCLELFIELFLGTIYMGIVHVQTTNTHQSEKFAALFVTVTCSIFR